jgi:hypothetical protein
LTGLVGVAAALTTFTITRRIWCRAWRWQQAACPCQRVLEIVNDRRRASICRRTFHLDSNVVPTSGLDIAAFPSNVSPSSLMLCVVPTPDIPPNAIFIVVDMKENEEAPTPSFAGRQFQSVIIPPSVTGQGPDKFFSAVCRNAPS